MPDAQVPIKDFLELYDAAYAVIDKIKMHCDHGIRRRYECSQRLQRDRRESAQNQKFVASCRGE